MASCLRDCIANLCLKIWGAQTCLGMGEAALHCYDGSQLAEKRDVASPEAEDALWCALCSKDDGKVAWQNRGASTFLRELKFRVIYCPSKAPSDRGAHSQRLTQPSPLISSFLHESSPWKDAALQEDIPGGFNHCTRSSPAALVV